MLAPSHDQQRAVPALHLFAKDGYEAVSVSAIAGELGMTKGALYKHYRSKRDIFDSILARMERAAEHGMPEARRVVREADKGGRRRTRPRPPISHSAFRIPHSRPAPPKGRSGALFMVPPSCQKRIESRNKRVYNRLEKVSARACAGGTECKMELICLGDSLTYGYGVRRAQCWTELAARETGWTLRNCGVCGDTTGGMLARMRELLREDPHRRGERYFLLMGGCNDLFYSGRREGAQENMAAMVHQLFAVGEAPLVALGPGLGGVDYPQSWLPLTDFEAAEALVRDYYAWLERFCDVFGVRSIDFRRDFRDAAGQPRTELYLDGLHLNEQGHRVMAERVAKVIGVMEREQMDA